MAELPYLVGRHGTSMSITGILITTSNQHDYCLTSVKNGIHGGYTITDPPVLPSIVNIQELLSLLIGLDAENVPPACVCWMRTWIVLPKHQFANGTTYSVRTDENIAFMGCLVRAVTELVSCASASA